MAPKLAFLVQLSLSVGDGAEGNQDSASVPLRTSIMRIGLLHNDVVFSEPELSRVSFGGAICFGRGPIVIRNSMVCETCLEESTELGQGPITRQQLCWKSAPDSGDEAIKRG